MMLQQAILEHRLVWMRYHSQSQDERTKRHIEPQTLSYNQGAWYVDGYCRLRSEPRGFRLNRIEDLRLLDEHFEPRLVFSPPTNPVDVRVRFAPEFVRWVQERQHYAYQSQEATDAGTIMTYRVTAWSEIRPWLLSWGASAELLELVHWGELLRQELNTLITLLTWGCQRQRVSWGHLDQIQGGTMNSNHNSLVIEMARARLSPGVDPQAFLQLSDDLLPTLQSLPGFIRRELWQMEDGEWVDILYWESLEDALNAAEIFPTFQGAQSLMEVLDLSTLTMQHLKQVRSYS